jgi:hypothetical protein
MHRNKYLHLPIVENGIIFGMADILQLTFAVLQELNDLESTSQGPMWARFWDSVAVNEYSLDSHHDTFQVILDDFETIAPDDSASMVLCPKISNVPDDSNDIEKFVFKFKDEVVCKTFRITSSIKDLNAVKVFIAEKVYLIYGRTIPKSLFQLCYLDEDDDFVNLDSDRDLEDAVLMARAIGWRSLIIMIDRRRMGFDFKPLQKIYNFRAHSKERNDPFEPDIDLKIPLVFSGLMGLLTIFIFTNFLKK